MTPRTRRARQIQLQIRDILLRDWDPIGVAQEAHAPDEYDSYVGEVYRLLATGASPQSVAEHLAMLAAKRMGLATPADKLLPAAAKLCALNVSLLARDRSE